MDIVIVEPKARPKKKRDGWRNYRDNVARHATYRKKRRGPFRGIVQALYEDRK